MGTTTSHLTFPDAESARNEAPEIIMGMMDIVGIPDEGEQDKGEDGGSAPDEPVKPAPTDRQMTVEEIDAELKRIVDNQKTSPASWAKMFENEINQLLELRIKITKGQGQ